MYFKGEGKVLDDLRLGVEKQCRIRLCANTPVQIAGAAALNGPQDFVKGIVEKLRERRDYAWKRLNEIEGISATRPEGAFYIFPKIHEVGSKVENRHGICRATPKRNRCLNRQWLGL